MKKTLLLAGLFGACISINAQESFKYGFEDGEVFGRIYEDDIFDDDPTPQGRWQTALFTDIGEDETIQSEWYLPIPEEGRSAFESEELSRSGLKCMYIKNNVGKCPWENQAALDNLIFNDMTSYRFTFWVKAPAKGDFAWGGNIDTKIQVIPEKGYLWGNQELKTADGVNSYSKEFTGFNPDEYVKKTMMFFYTNSELLDAAYPGNEIADNFRITFRFPYTGEYFVDDIELKKSSIAGIRFNDDLMQVDFGYQINTDNILDKGVSVVLYPTEALEVKANDEPVSINRVEYRADGKFYIVLDDVLDMNANVTVSFKNPVADADNAMKYDDVLAPINPEEAYQGYVLDFSAETADFDDSFYFELTEIEEVDPDADTKLLFAYGFEPGETFGNKGENAWEVVLPIDGGTVVCGEIDDPLNYARNGYGSMFVENPERGAGFWTNGVCMKDLKFSENTSYRVTFWVKGDGFSMVDGLQNQIKVNAYKGGTWNHLIAGVYDGSFENEDGTEGAYLEYTTQYGAEEGGELTEDEWKMKTYMFYYPTNEYMQQTWEKNGNESTLSEDYRLEFNVYGQGKFAIDDISVYKSTIAGVTYKDNTLLVDFGFAIDSEYVWDNDDMVVIYPASAFKVTANDERVPVVRRELYPDGKIRLFLSESVSANDVVKVSFRNPVNDGENCLYYGSMLHPGSTDTEFDDWKVKNFTNEKATYDGTLEIVRTPLINEVEDQEDTFDEEIEAGIATQRVSGLDIEVKGDNITVSSEKSDVVTINIYNTLGSLVMQKQVVSGASVSTKSLQKGVYIVRASAKGENSKVIKTEL